MPSPTAAQVVRARSGDAGAFAELIRSFERTALAVAFAVTGQGAAAADVCQEAFLRAWRRLGELSDPEKFGAWLAGIVRNAALDHRRALKREATVSWDAAIIDDSGSQLDPRTDADRRELHAALAGALAALDPVSRECVALRYYRSLSSREIGALTGLSPAAVDMRLSRAREELRRRLEPASAGRVRGEP